MARTGITYDQVVEACSQLIMSGESPTIQRVRTTLGNTGSPNTIHKHLTDWRAVAPIKAPKTPELPAELQTAIVKELERQTTLARADLEDKLAEVQTEARELAKTGEQLELDNRELDEANQGLSGENQRFDALVQERGEAINRLEKELITSREAAESARSDLAQLRQKADSESDQLQQLGEDVKSVRDELAQEVSSKTASEKELAVAEAQLGELEKVGERQIGQVESLTTELSTVRSSSETHKIEIVRLESERDGLLKTNEQQSTLLEKLDDDLATVMTEQNLAVQVTASNEAKLESAEEKIEDQKSQILKPNVLLQGLKKMA